jgi:hypothetical protein
MLWKAASLRKCEEDSEKVMRYHQAEPNSGRNRYRSSELEDKAIRL